MKIAIVGCGALGGYYGAKLCQAGQEVHVLLRSDYDAVRRQGIAVTSSEGDFTAHPLCAQTPREIGVSDLVIIGLKTTANAEFPGLLPPLVGPHTAVLTLQNGLGNEEQLARLFPVGQILGGLCFVCLNRVAPGVVRHIGHGLIVLGEFQRPPTPRTQALADLFNRAGVRCQVAEDLARAHWEKLVWNIPFNGLGVASAAGWKTFVDSSSKFPARNTLEPCLTTDCLLADPRWEKLVRELMREVIAAANALGLPVPETFAEKQLERTRTMGAYRASTLVDFERGQPLELESLFMEPLRQARAARARVPVLERLCSVLQRLDRR